MKQLIDEQFRELTTLNRASYKECVFENCNFNNQNFNLFQFITCNLSNLEVTETSLKTVSFDSCKMVGIDFSQANSFLLKINFRGCNLNLSSFCSMNLPKIKFIDCNLSEVDFSEANLNESDFSGSTFTNAIFDQTDLTKANFINAENFSINPLKKSSKKSQLFPRECIWLVN